MIGIDYTAAYEQGGGIGRYVRELVRALAHQDTQTPYRLFVSGAATNHLPDALGPNFIWQSTRLSNRWLARIWHKAHLPIPIEIFTGRIDLFHSTDFVLPPVRPQTRTLLTVHDLSFVHTPETAVPSLRRYLNNVVPSSIRRADHVLADSEATRQDILSLYGTPSSKVSVLLSGVGQQFSPTTDPIAIQAVRARYNLGDWPYIFTIGTVQPRKNYARLVQVMAILRQQYPDLHLVIAGGRGWLEDELYIAIDKYQQQDTVHLIGYTDDADLPALYSGAQLTAFVSLYEGFGFPVLESMACGTPVVTSNVSSLPEVAGTAAITVSPTDIDAIVDAIRRLLGEDSVNREKRRIEGLQWAAQFTWERAAHQLLDVYRRMLA